MTCQGHILGWVISSTILEGYAPWTCFNKVEECSCFACSSVHSLRDFNQICTHSVYQPYHTFSQSRIKSTIFLLGDIGRYNLSFVLFHISSKFVLFLECYLISPKMHRLNRAKDISVSLRLVDWLLPNSSISNFSGREQVQ
jgi:hypothetical protein